MGDNQFKGMGELNLMIGQYECIVPLLDNEWHQSCLEGLCECVKVTNYGVSVPPTHNPDGVVIHTGKSSAIDPTMNI